MQDPTENPIAAARTALAAASATRDPEVSALYLAVARNAVAKAAEELRALEVLLVARERELVHRVGPRQQVLPVADTGVP